MNPCLVPGLKAELLEEVEHMAFPWGSPLGISGCDEFPFMCPVFLKFSLFWSVASSSGMTELPDMEHLAQRVLWGSDTS